MIEKEIIEFHENRQRLLTALIQAYNQALIDYSQTRNKYQIELNMIDEDLKRLRQDGITK